MTEFLDKKIQFALSMAKELPDQSKFASSTTAPSESVCHNGVSEQDVAGEAGRRLEVMAVTGDISESACRTVYQLIAFFTHKMED